jgi:opacity protein-like surface antigen
MTLKYLLPAALLAVAFAPSLVMADSAPADFGGLYVGATGGVQFSGAHFELPGDTGDALQETNNNRMSIIPGGLIGFNEQIGIAVFGVEADISDGGGTTSVTACTVPDGCFTPTHDSFTTLNHLKNDFTGRLRGRVGWVDGNDFYFVSAGYSYAGTKLSLVGLCYNPGDPTVPLVFNFDRSRMTSGFNVGAGLERAFGDHFAARAEIVYDNYSNQLYEGAAPEWNNRVISLTDTTLRVAIEYRI